MSINEPTTEATDIVEAIRVALRGFTPTHHGDAADGREVVAKAASGEAVRLNLSAAVVMASSQAPSLDQLAGDSARPATEALLRVPPGSWVIEHTPPGGQQSWRVATDQEALDFLLQATPGAPHPGPADLDAAADELLTMPGSTDVGPELSI